VLCENDDITLLYTDFYKYLYSLLNSDKVLEEYKERQNLYKILEIFSKFLHHNIIIEDTNYNDFEIIKDDKDTENYLLKIKGNGIFGWSSNIDGREQFITSIDIDAKIDENISEENRNYYHRSSSTIRSFYLKYTGEGGLLLNKYSK